MEIYCSFYIWLLQTIERLWFVVILGGFFSRLLRVGIGRYLMVEPTRTAVRRGILSQRRGMGTSIKDVLYAPLGIKGFWARDDRFHPWGYVVVVLETDSTRLLFYSLCWPISVSASSSPLGVCLSKCVSIIKLDCSGYSSPVAIQLPRTKAS